MQSKMMEDDGVRHDVLFCLVNGRYITLRGIYRSMVDKHCWILCTVTLDASGLGKGITELSQAAFTKDQWSDLSTRFCELVKSGNVRIKNYKRANEFADMILSKGL